MVFSYGVDVLTASKALEISKGKLKTRLTETTKNKIKRSHKAVLAIAQKEKPVYGINTGFGPLCNTIISKKDTSLLQSNLLKSHAVGVGQPISIELAKLMLILKVHSLSQGFSGISMPIMNRILWHIKRDLIPMVPEQGSVGASGDLAPLSHLFLPLIGEGQIYYQDKLYSTAYILKKFGKKPLNLPPKAGLALINGTQFIAAHAVMVVTKLHSCLNQADIIGAMMVEALLGSKSPFEAKLHKIRPYKSNIHVAHRLNALVYQSEIMASHINCNKVQDPYSLRCMPQVHGSSRKAWLHLKEATETEINSVTDNPIIFSEKETISGGNFHGQPLALPLDYAALAAAELGNISDRRAYLSLEGKSDGVPKLLLKETGLNSGFMIVQYTGAALVSENKSLCFPASADSIPTSLGQEDHVSMGSISGRKALQICNNLEKILAVELLCAAQAFDFHRPLKSSKPIELIHKHVRSKIKHAKKDRIFGYDINAAIEIVKSNKLIELSSSFKNLKSPFEKLFESY